jgi:hypothetical protein
MTATPSESLERSTERADLLCASLRVALAGSTATEALILLPLIEQAAGLLNALRALDAARSQDA